MTIYRSFLLLCEETSAYVSSFSDILMRNMNLVDAAWSLSIIRKDQAAAKSWKELFAGWVGSVGR